MKIGIALAGGGARGAYQIGVWKALKEKGLEPSLHAFSGASVGSVNAIFFAMGDYELAYQLWSMLERDTLFLADKHMFSRFFKERWRFFTKGIYDTSNFEKLIDEHVNTRPIKSKEVYIATTAIGGMRKKFFRMLKVNYRYHFEKNRKNLVFHNVSKLSKKRIKKLLLASCAIPVVFRPVEYEGETYYDGGILNNVPFVPLQDTACDKILIIDLFRVNFHRKKDTSDENIAAIFPSRSLGGILDFSPKKIQKRIDLGYKDGIRFIEENPDFFKEK